MDYTVYQPSVAEMNYAADLLFVSWVGWVLVLLVILLAVFQGPISRFFSREGD